MQLCSYARISSRLFDTASAMTITGNDGIDGDVYVFIKSSIYTLHTTLNCCIETRALDVLHLAGLLSLRYA